MENISKDNKTVPSQTIISRQLFATVVRNVGTEMQNNIARYEGSGAAQHCHYGKTDNSCGEKRTYQVADKDTGEKRHFEGIKKKKM